MNEDFKFWIIVISGFIATMFLVGAVSIFDCAQYRDATGKEVKMEYGTCYVKAGGEWFSKDQIRGVK